MILKTYFFIFSWKSLAWLQLGWAKAILRSKMCTIKYLKKATSKKTLLITILFEATLWAEMNDSIKYWEEVDEYIVWIHILTRDETDQGCLYWKQLLLEMIRRTIWHKLARRSTKLVNKLAKFRRCINWVHIEKKTLEIKVWKMLVIAFRKYITSCGPWLLCKWPS